MKHDLQQNKKNAIEFYRTAYLGDPITAINIYVGDDYIQHNPSVANGKQGFISYFEEMTRDYSDKSIKYIRSIAEDDLVTLHTHQIWPGNEEYVTIDIFRFDGYGKIIEHWDAVQKISETSNNENKIY